MVYNYSNESVYSEKKYLFYKIDSDFYLTLKPHTLRFFMYVHQSDNLSPLYIKMFNKSSNYLSGFSSNQVYGNSISMIRLEYRYRFKSDIHFHLILNNIFDMTIDDNYKFNNIPSYGLGTTLTSMAGNIELVLGYSPQKISDLKSYQYTLKVNAGYKF